MSVDTTRLVHDCIMESQQKVGWETHSLGPHPAVPWSPAVTAVPYSRLLNGHQPQTLCQQPDGKQPTSHLRHPLLLCICFLGEANEAHPTLNNFTGSIWYNEAINSMRNAETFLFWFFSTAPINADLIISLSDQALSASLCFIPILSSPFHLVYPHGP